MAWAYINILTLKVPVTWVARWLTSLQLQTLKAPFSSLIRGSRLQVVGLLAC